ncbi:CobW family GTP-binding protein [Paenibacillus spongiae]|uniref:GTP-binding protein n=1 Tax=Paenibacillus spongiae TaxID=2909671 RepID=A0ABY5SBZ7_9BACL|nr:GTP-binding protein [Paenibacillus spongiae]UVI31294.1 GTP-binding protein [Paenibacillus spongiae]
MTIENQQDQQIQQDQQDQQDQQRTTVPVHLLSGFLGSGKTTLLNQVIDYYKAADVKAAVIMNELGDVNLDGQIIGDDVPMAEMLGGCLCCTIRGDLSLELKSLLDEYKPDVVLIESTGAANPMEIMDAVTETAMYALVDLRTVVTVVDGPELLSRRRKGGRTFRLMQEQIRCATDLIVNKADKLAPEELIEVEQLVRELNEYAPLTVTVRCVTEMSIFDPGRESANGKRIVPAGHSGHVCGANCSHGDHAGDEHNTDADHDAAGTHPHASHEHVMALTHYLTGPVDSHDFEQFMAKLPKEVYRAKGILTFADTNSRFLFQYAYRELDFMRITPQSHVNDVAVFIGEHFAKGELLQELERLQRQGRQQPGDPEEE